MDCWDKLLNGFIWLIDKLNNYNGLIIAILTVIGFLYIRKQIKIAKNKDILFSFQKDITLYLNQIYSNNIELSRQLANILNDFIIPNNIDMSDDDLEESKENEIIKLLDEMIEFCNDFYVGYISRLENNLLNYNWWLSIHNNDFSKILNSENFNKLNEFPHQYSSLIESFKPEHCDEIVILDDITVSKMRKIIYEKPSESIQILNEINNEINKFLKKLAKDKGVL